MQTTNYALTERLENVYRSMSLSPHHQTTSLLNEMEMSDSEKSLNASRRPFSQIDEDEDVEVENPEIRINSEELTDEVSKKSWMGNVEIQEFYVKSILKVIWKWQKLTNGSQTDFT